MSACASPLFRKGLSLSKKEELPNRTNACSKFSSRPFVQGNLARDPKLYHLPKLMSDCPAQNSEIGRGRRPCRPEHFYLLRQIAGTEAGCYQFKATLLAFGHHFGQPLYVAATMQGWSSQSPGFAHCSGAVPFRKRRLHDQASGIF